MDETPSPAEDRQPPRQNADSNPLPPVQAKAATVVRAAPPRVGSSRKVAVEPAESKRDTIIALLCGIGVLAFILVGFIILNNLKTQPSANKLTGVITEKYATGQVEKEISFGKKGVSSQEVDSGFYFKIQVPSEGGRIFEVPVNEGMYQARKVGDQQSFIRPRSEQK